MVLQRRFEYGFNGYQVPHTPRAARSRRNTSRRRSVSNPISSFDVLAAVAGKLLLERGGNSSSSSNNASANNEDQGLVKNESVDGADQMEGEETNGDRHENNPERSFFVSEILPKAHEMQSFNRSPSPPKDFHFGSTSGVTSDSSEKFENQELAYEETKIHNGHCYRSEIKDKKSLLRGLNSEPKLSRNVVAKDEHHIGSGFRKAIPQNPSVCSDDIDVLARGGNDDDDDENFSARYTRKSFRSTLRTGDRRIKKVVASKYCKVPPRPKDTMVANSDLDLKSDYYSKKHCLKSLRSERNFPIKKRKYFDGYTASQSDETVKSEGLSSSPKKASGFISSIAGQKQPTIHSRDSQMKVGIKSFRVPELFIEIPETATVGSLKRTVLEAVTTILGNGLRVGVLVNGKKVRDDNKTLLQNGISLDTLSDSLGFCLEPNPPQSTKPVSPEDSGFMRPTHTPRSLTRCLPSSGKHAKPSNSVESDLDSKPSAPYRANKPVYSRALVHVAPVHAQALTVVPPRKTKRSEVAQRRIRRPFSVAEVEALVQAVERLGTGRWRDVKLRAFDNAKHRTYVDLKDKWKTLVHTARISPQQRRGEPVPQELLDRVLTAHAYWPQQQGKHLLLEGPEKLETSLGL